VLAEPPSRAVLLLVCAAAGRLLPTIRSRTRRLRMDPLDLVAMNDVLARALPERTLAARARLAELSEGSPGRAIDLASGDGLDVAALVQDVLAKLPNLPPILAHTVADAIGRDDEAFGTFFDMLRAALAAGVRDTARGHGNQSLRAR